MDRSAKLGIAETRTCRLHLISLSHSSAIKLITAARELQEELVRPCRHCTTHMPECVLYLNRLRLIEFTVHDMSSGEHFVNQISSLHNVPHQTNSMPEPDDHNQLTGLGKCL